MRLEYFSEGKPDDLAEILVDDTLFDSTSSFRHDEIKIDEGVKMGEGLDLSDGLLNFECLEVEQMGDHLVFHQRQYLKQKKILSRLPLGSEMTKMVVKKSSGTVGWLATIACHHAAFLVSQLNQVTFFDDEARNLANRSVELR